MFSSCVIAAVAALSAVVGASEMRPAKPEGQDLGDGVQLFAEGKLGDPGQFGLRELDTALRQKGIATERVSAPSAADDARIMAGIAESAPQIRHLIERAGASVPAEPESYVIRKTVQDGYPALLVAGSDKRGLMYGLLEVERQVNRPGAPSTLAGILSHVTEDIATPTVSVRGMIQFLHNADLERSWYYDPDYWKSYLGMLARCRFNSFNLVFAHQTHYLAPPYPFLFEVEKYPQVRVPGLRDADRRRNLETLRMISSTARQHGIDFIMGIWQQRAWKDRQPGMVEGLTDDILADYARLAMEKLLRLCPDITGIQLRVNDESGIEASRQTVFYRGGVLAGMKAAGRPVLLDLRGWGALPETIEAAAGSGLPMRLSVKYWAEFMGMPYQAAKMLPSYSYVDFLRYPRRFPVLYQVWSLGSHRLLPWGSVDWVKRFAPTTKLGGGIGFETCAPLSQKGFGNAPGDWRILIPPEREYYRWEFERYWLYYLLYGRLTYDPGTPSDVWMDEFRRRFGDRGAAAVFDAFQRASDIIPFLVSYRLSNPNMYIWPEKQMGGLLDFYIEVKPADPARFADFQEYVARRLRGAVSAKMIPEEASERLRRMAEETERAVARADALIDASGNKEYRANRVDLLVLSLLARYHSRKILAGAALALFYSSGDAAVLRSAQSHAAAALGTWERLARLTEGIYHPRMVFGPQDTGHWKDNLVFVRHDVDRLKEVEELFERYGLFDVGLDFGPKITMRRHPYEPPYATSYSVERRFHPLDPETVYSRMRGYGWREANGIEAPAPMRIPYASLEGDNLEGLALPRGVLQRDYLKGTGASTLLVDLPDGEYRVVCLVGNIPEVASGPFEVRARAAADTRSVRFEPDETGDKWLDVSVTGGQMAIDLLPGQGSEWLVSGLTITRREPHIGHVPMRAVSPGVRTGISATILAPDGVDAAWLHMVSGGRETAVIPLSQDAAEFGASVRWPASADNAGYFITARDKRGCVARAPASGWFNVVVGEDLEPPRVRHNPPPACRPGTDLSLEFEIGDDSAIGGARLFYRHLNQTENYRETALTQVSGKYRALIPGRFITADHDLMYYVEAVDRFGNGSFYPDPDRAAPYVVAKSIH
ncbi:MAG: hypothetical protein HXY20_13905 [Acidobacteria bacterium]|nr:hypothetical protein [Acidobacteriota bacterium]